MNDKALKTQEESTSPPNPARPELPKLTPDYRIFNSREERDQFKRSPSREQINTIEKKYTDTSDTFLFNFKNLSKWLHANPASLLEEHLEQRDKISVLVIIGSGFDYFPPNFINNFQFLSNAFLIRHLFHYGFGIPYNRVLLTSCEEKDFKLFSNPNARILPDSSPKKHNEESSPSPTYTIFNNNVFKHPDDFEFANCVFSQVGKSQYQFIPDGKISNIIKPFNSYFIEKYLETNDETELYVFFLDNGIYGKFCPYNYNYFIERLIQIHANHYIVFNDCCHSGLLLELIDISLILVDIFQDKQTILIDAFKSILSFTRLTKVQNQPKQTKEEVCSHIQELKPVSFSQKKYDDIIENISSKLSKYAAQLNTIDPLMFVNFRKKASVFCSCYADMFSFSLPIRDFYIGIDSATSAHGSIYLSCVIDCLFNKKFNPVPNDFVKQLQASFVDMKTKFEDLIIEQNTYVEDDFTKILTPKAIDDIKEKSSEILLYIDQFFKTDYTNPKTFYSQHQLPDMSSLLIPKQYWPIIITDVDPRDYEYLKIYHYIPTSYNNSSETTYSNIVLKQMN